MRRLVVLAIVVGCRGSAKRAAHDDAAPSRDAAAAAARPIERAPIVERFDDAAVGTLSAGTRAGTLVWGAHGGVAAWVIRDADGKEHAVVNGAVSSLAFDHVSDLELARDGITPIYVGNLGGAIDEHGFVTGGTEQVVVGDRAGPVYGHALTLHDGDEPDAPFSYLAYVGYRAEQLVVEGRPGPIVDDVQIEHLSWLPDGTPTFRGTKDGASRVVIGDDVGPAYLDNSRPRVAPRAGVIAYMGQLADGQHVFLGRTAGPRYDEISELEISPDGMVGYEGKRDGQIWAVVGTRELGPYRRALDFTFGAGGRVAFSARRGERWFVVADGEEGAAYDRITESPTFSPDGAHVAYGVETADGDVVVRDGKVQGRPAPSVGFLRWSDDGRHLAWQVRRDREVRIVVDGVEGAAYDELGTAGFDDAGAVTYEGARAGRECLIRGATETCHDDVGVPHLIAGYERVNFTFDAHRRHLAYRARTGGSWTVIVDGVAGPGADAVWEPIWNADGTKVGWGARVGDALSWHVVAITAP